MNVLQVIRAGLAVSRLVQALIAEKSSENGLTVAEIWSIALSYLPEIIAPFGVNIPLPAEGLDLAKLASVKVKLPSVGQ